MTSGLLLTALCPTAPESSIIVSISISSVPPHCTAVTFHRHHPDLSRQLQCLRALYEHLEKLAQQLLPYFRTLEDMPFEVRGVTVRITGNKVQHCDMPTTKEDNVKDSNVNKSQIQRLLYSAVLKGEHTSKRPATCTKSLYEHVSKKKRDSFEVTNSDVQTIANSPQPGSQDEQSSDGNTKKEQYHADRWSRKRKLKALEETYAAKKEEISEKRKAMYVTTKANHLERERKKYATNEQYRNSTRNASHKKYYTDLEYKHHTCERSKKRYASNEVFQQHAREQSKKKYASDHVFQQSVRDHSKEKYASDPVFQQSVRDHSKEKYASDHVFQQSVRDHSKEKYASDPVFQQSVRDHSKEKYASDPVFQQSVRDHSKEKYASDPVFQQSVRDHSKEKYASDPVFQQSVRDHSKEKYASDPVFQQSVRDHSKEKYASDPVFQLSVRDHSKEKYASDPVFQLSVRDHSKEKYASDPVFQQSVRDHSKEKYASDPVFQQSVRDWSKNRYANTPDLKKRLCEATMQKYHTDEKFRDAIKMKSINLTAAVVYRPASYPVAIFCQHLKQLIDLIDQYPGMKIIMGDFNENALDNGAQTSSPNSSGTSLGKPSTMYRKSSSLLAALSFSCCTTIINMQDFALAKLLDCFFNQEKETMTQLTCLPTLPIDVP
ncbi:hypothetical protein ABVT39_002645 [Epinephelus coioides]